MLYVKIMSDQDMPDTDPYKNYSIVMVGAKQTMHFADNPVGGTDRKYPRYVLRVYSEDGSEESYELNGNAYVMNDTGKTIATHGC